MTDHVERCRRSYQELGRRSCRGCKEGVDCDGPMVKKHGAWDAYCAAYKTAQQARDRGRDYISIERSNVDPGYVLNVTKCQDAMWRVRRQESVMGWAEQIVYRLEYLGCLSDSRDEVDRVFAERDRVGAGSLYTQQRRECG